MTHLQQSAPLRFRSRDGTLAIARGHHVADQHFSWRPTLFTVRLLSVTTVRLAHDGMWLQHASVCLPSDKFPREVRARTSLPLAPLPQLKEELLSLC